MDILLPYSHSLSLFFFFLLLLLVTTIRAETCSPSYCGNSSSLVSIRFPFKLRGDDGQSVSCAYIPGFEVYCDKKTALTFINLTNAGEFVVKNVSYNDRKLWISDPSDCLAKRYLSRQTSIDLTGSPFQLSDDLSLVNVTFIKCSKRVYYYPLQPITCLSDGHNSVLAMVSDSDVFFPAPSPFPMLNISQCQVISSAIVPFHDFGTTAFLSDIKLQWNNPSCNYPNCEGGSKKKSKNSLALGLGMPAYLIFIMICCLINYYAMRRDENQEQVEAAGNTRSDDDRQQLLVAAAAAATNNQATMNNIIERYPKAQVEDNGELPNPNDNECSICLCEYQPKDILRTSRDCNHYFHALCLEGWLKNNASCPLCRNLPKSSFSVSSSTSQSSSSS